MTAQQRLVLVTLFICLLAAVGVLTFLLTHPPQEAAQAAHPEEAPAGETALPVDLPATWTVTPTDLPPPTATRCRLTATLLPTPTGLPAMRPTAVSATPSYIHPSATLPIPTAVPRFAIPEQAITIVLLGSDQRPDWDDWHTDAIQYLVVYPDIPAAALLSIPRDLYVYVPGFWMSRINFADMYGEVNQYEGGGLGLLNQTLLHNLGISADYAIKVNFDGLIGLVDSLEGIDVPVHCRLEDYWPYPQADGSYPRLVLEPGVHHLDGEQALWYSRSRKTTSVFSREWRQQQVLEAMWQRGRQTNLIEYAPALYQEMDDLFQTDLGLGNILSLGMTAMQLDPVNLKFRNIGAGQVIPHTTPYGGGVYLPVWQEIEPIIADVLTPPSSNRATQNPLLVQVWDASGQADWDQLVADRLYRNGYLPLLEEQAQPLQTSSQIYFFGETTKGSGLAWLQTLLEIDDQSVIHQPDATAPVALRLVIGQDYKTCWR